MLVGALNITFEIAPIVTEDKALTRFPSCASRTASFWQCRRPLLQEISGQICVWLRLLVCEARAIFTQVSSETTDDTHFLESARELPLQVALAIDMSIPLATCQGLAQWATSIDCFSRNRCQKLPSHIRICHLFLKCGRALSHSGLSIQNSRLHSSHDT